MVQNKNHGERDKEVGKGMWIKVSSECLEDPTEWGGVDIDVTFVL